jgi:Holliday junction resolvasome RuvABC endonuclease subunit
MHNNYKRINEIPEFFPLKHYELNKPKENPHNKIIVGFDSGISHGAFIELELIWDGIGYSGLKINNHYYFENDILKYGTWDERIFFIGEKYWQLFSQKSVDAVVFELLPLNVAKNEVLKGLIYAQRATDILTLTCHSLNHPYFPLSPKQAKYLICSNGAASKEAIQIAAFEFCDKQCDYFLNNSHLADAFALCFVKVVEYIREAHICYGTPIPQKFNGMDWIKFD